MTTPQGVHRLDELAGGGAIVRAAGLPPELIHAALAVGDRSVQALVHAAGEVFGLALASLVNVLNPDAVRVAGGTLGYRGYWDAALRTAQENALPELWHACTVARIENPELVVARGAIRLATAMADGKAWVRQYASVLFAPRAGAARRSPPCESPRSAQPWTPAPSTPPPHGACPCSNRKPPPDNQPKPNAGMASQRRPGGNRRRRRRKRP
ncbi:hypothetical protein [Streptomyces sp. SLBN-118]|uniref:hypothetical protein n=1 Tax=Streptomyces sp. SLBN-118 TaxID=2768454 RepID=UPI001150CEF2|nr:hypothetical protein [Streptomyces sp. SLBN-118]